MRRKIPTLQALSCFEAAARHESYTRAAAELALTQGAVSRQIAALEAFLGLTLFRRARHGVSLTADGAAYARQVSARLDGLERDTFDAMAGQSSGGALQLASVPTFATRWLVPRLPALAARHPDLTVHIETRTRPFLFSDTGFDAALYAGTAEQIAHWPGTRALLLMPEAAVPVGSPGLLAGRRRWRPQELARLPLLQQSTRPQAWREWFEAAGVDAAMTAQGPRHELFSMLAAAAAQGLGLALIPRMLIEPELARGELVVACDPRVPPRRGYYFITPDTGGERAVVSLFRAWLLVQTQTA